MVNIRSQPHRSPPPGEVGEIDTRAPFQSVRAAVSLFGAVATIKGKASLPSFKRQPSAVSENAKPNRKLSPETKLMLAEKDLAKFKTKLETAEAAKAAAIADLESSRGSLDELNAKIIAAQEAKHSIMESTEATRHRAMKLQAELSREDITADGPFPADLDHEREQYALVAKELHSTKQYLTKIRQDFDAAMEEKTSSLRQATDAHSAAESHTEKSTDLRKEIAALLDSIEHLKLETQRSGKMKIKILAERDSLLQSYKPAKEEAERKQRAMKKEFNPELTRILQQQYAETSAEIQQVKDQMRIVLTSEMTSIKDVTDDVAKAKSELQDVSSEETTLRASVETLRTDLENVKKDIAEAEKKEKQMEVLSLDLQDQLKRCKQELEGLADFHEDEHFSKLHRLLSLTNVEKRTEEEIKKTIAELKKETENLQTAQQQSESKIQDAVADLEQATEAQKLAMVELTKLSDVEVEAQAAKIRMSKKEYESMNKKAEEANNVAEMKVAAAMVQVGSMGAKRSEAESQVENTVKEIERMQAVIEFALKQADASEAAQKEIEAQLQRWRKQ